MGIQLHGARTQDMTELSLMMGLLTPMSLLFAGWEQGFKESRTGVLLPSSVIMS